MLDIIVIGGGPAGMTAALYALRNGKTALVLEKHGFGGQITYSPKVENWPGTAQMSGNEYADAFLDQIMAQGAEVDLAEAVRVEDHGTYKTVFTDDGQQRDARAVIIAAGVKHRMLGLPGENELVGEGISFCAVCDGLFVAVGLIPENDAFKDLAALNSWGYFDSDERCETKTPGIFVAGDCRSKSVRQLTTAAADGATAALAACRYIASM